MIDRWLVRWFVSSPEQVGEARTREAYGVLEGWVSIVVNVFIFAVKLVPGILIGSISLVADAFHSLGDVLSSIVVIWGFKVAARPADREHPFGHGRVESVATLVIGILLFVAAWEFGQNSVIRLMNPRPVAASNGLLALLAVTLVLKEWLSRFARDLGRTIDSSVLRGDFWHHRSDVFATAVVIAALFAARFGWDWVDGVAGLVIAGFIAYAAYELTRAAINPLIGEAPSPQLLAEIRGIALAVPEVDQVHDVVVHFYGGVMVTSLHIEIADSLDITRAHDLAEAVEGAINERFHGWAVVHVDPINRRHPLFAEVQAFLEESLPAIPFAEGFHDLRIVGSAGPSYVIFDLKADSHHAPVIADRLREAVARRFPDVAKVVVNVEPRYVY
ncbi:MAG: cation diffusion facilitator family transporter [Thermoanaerobaculaceae bacterium]|jgi:cation diffusion facilitator family transporter